MDTLSTLFKIITSSFSIAVVLFFCPRMIGQSVASPNYTIIDLGKGNAYGINDYGDVVGVQKISPSYFAFLWKNGVMTDLGNLGKSDSIQVWDINNSLQIVGFSMLSSGYIHAFSWKSDIMTDLGTVLGAEESYAYSLNDYGYVVGMSGDKGVIFYGGNSIQAIDSLNGTVDINNSYQIVGSFITESGYQRAAMWENGIRRDLGVLSGHNASSANAINERGQIVGASFIFGGSNVKAFIWQDDAIAELNISLDGTHSAHDINDSGQVVGTYLESGVGGEFRGFLYQNGVFHFLSDLIDTHPVYQRICSARAINQVGQIVGEGYVYGDTVNQHAFLMTPLPDPEKVVTPAFSPVPGWLKCSEPVQITCDTSDAIIFYTTNGADPTEASILYTGPITLEASSALKARAYKQGWILSEIAKANYTTNIDVDYDGFGDCIDNCPNFFNPNQLDTDHDQIGDLCDIDDDNDGMPDAWERIYSLDPLKDDSKQDADGDGWTNLQEYHRGTDPKDPKSHPSKAMPWLHLLLLEE